MLYMREIYFLVVSLVWLLVVKIIGVVCVWKLVMVLGWLVWLIILIVWLICIGIGKGFKFLFKVINICGCYLIINNVNKIIILKRRVSREIKKERWD